MQLRAMLTAGIDLLNWPRAQMGEQYSMLEALSRMPGIYFFASGTTIVRPAMERYTAVRGIRWLLAPHPLQVLDAITGLLAHGWPG